MGDPTQRVVEPLTTDGLEAVVAAIRDAPGETEIGDRMADLIDFARAVTSGLMHPLAASALVRYGVSDDDRNALVAALDGGMTVINVEDAIATVWRRLAHDEQR